MRRAKFIILALVAALILMGAGYAAWTQTFTVNSNTSTGELFVKVVKGGTNKVEVVKDGGGYVDATDVDTNYLDGMNTIAVETSSTEKNRGNASTLSALTCTLGKVYPGTKITNTITFQNLGTIGTETLVADTSTIENPNSALWKDLVITVNGENINKITTPNALPNKFDQLKEAIRVAVGNLEPDGQPKTVTIVQELPLSSSNETENLGLNWSVALSFQQYNKQ